MTKQTGRLLWWGLTKNPLRTFFLVLTIIGSLLAFSSTEATMRDLANKSADLWRSYPYDLKVTGPKAATRWSDFRAICGVRAMERTYATYLMVGFARQLAMVPTDVGQLLPIEYSQGRAPVGPDEIAISEQAATVQKLQVGDTVLVSLASGKELPTSFVVCGVTKYRFGTINCLTEAGMQSIDRFYPQGATILIARDRAVSAESIRAQISELEPKLQIELPEEEIMNNSVIDLSLMLTKLTSLVMLAAGVGGFYMLLSLSQQSRAYDFGVLRAVGFSSRYVVVQLMLEGIVLILLGVVIGGAMLLGLVDSLGLGDLRTLLQQNLQSMLLLLACCLFAAYRSATNTSSRPATEMIRAKG